MLSSLTNKELEEELKRRQTLPAVSEPQTPNDVLSKENRERKRKQVFASVLDDDDVVFEQEVSAWVCTGFLSDSSGNTTETSKGEDFKSCSLRNNESYANAAADQDNSKLGS